MTTTSEPTTTELDQRFSSEGATTTAWDDACKQLADAEISWISTVRPDGRPHVVPLMTVLMDDSLYFSTGVTEQKARNLEHNTNVAMTTGANSLSEGLDLVVEGEAVRVTDDSTLRAAAGLYETKYGWKFDVGDGVLHGAGGEDFLFRIKARKGFGFGRGDDGFSQTRWTF